MKIGDKAEASDAPDVYLPRDSVGLYRLESDELTGCDEITPEGEFPEYGDFLEVTQATGGANPSWGDTAYVSCPGDLAKQIVGMEIEPGDCFRIQGSRKNAQGNWTYSLSEESPDF
jgi:hypothetical protein